MKSTFSRVLFVGALCVMANTVFAQVPANNGGNGNRPNFTNMTSEQRQQMRDQMRATQIKQSLTAAGYADDVTQQAVVDFATAQNTASTTLLPKIEAIRTAFRDNADDKTVGDALTAYRTAVEEAGKTREAAITDLDKTISFSTKPKLEALLTMLGLIGDENGFVSNLAGQAQLPGATGGRGGGPSAGGGPGGMGGPGGPGQGGPGQG